MGKPRLREIHVLLLLLIAPADQCDMEDAFIFVPRQEHGLLRGGKDGDGRSLLSLLINTALVAERVTILKEYPFIGVMAYAAGENPFSYPELKYDKIKLFIAEAC